MPDWDRREISARFRFTTCRTTLVILMTRTDWIEVIDFNKCVS